MLVRLRLRRPSHATVVAYLALFVALGGTSAYAVNEWNGSNIQDETLTGADIQNGSLQGQDYGPGSVSGFRITDNNITTIDLADNAIFGDPDIANDSLTGDDVDETTLASLDTAEGQDAVCNPSSVNFVDCVTSSSVVLGRDMPVLVTGETHFNGEGATAPVAGNCRLELNDQPLSSELRIGELLSNTSSSVQQAGPQFTDVRNLPAGTWRFEVSCNETNSDVWFRNTRVTVVELGQD